MSYFVYIITNKSNRTIYIGVTNNLIRRIYEHREGFVIGFSKKYQLNKLIYFEEYKKITDAIRREKQLKNWKREWKLNLIKKINPEFDEMLK